MYIALMMFAITHERLKTELSACRIDKMRCEMDLERVPPSEFRRIADELAECKQHLDEYEEEHSSHLKIEKLSAVDHS